MISELFWIQLIVQALIAGVALFAGLNVGTGEGSSSVNPVALTAMIGLVALFGATTVALIMSWRSRVGEQERVARQAAEARVEQLSSYDALTGLLNRSVLMERLGQAIEGMRKGDGLVAVMCVDVVDFRAINETLGHAAGDLLLRHIGARLLANLRDSDVLARMSADEFAVVQVDVEGPDTAASLCERLIAAVEGPFDLHGNPVFAAVNIGVSLHPGDGVDGEQLLKHAGLALQRAKEQGGGGFRFFEDGMDAEMRQRKVLEQDLHLALQRGQLELHYQPQIDIGSRRMVGVEALLRWHHPQQGPVAPDVFIPLAEDSGLILPIGAWVLDQACAQAVRWQSAGARELRVSVNLSPIQFRDPDLPELVARTLERCGLEPRHLELEITERVLMDNTRANLRLLERLRALGVRISIDDFGVGHSSLSYLSHFQFDEIKVDRSFISGLGRERAADAIVRATLSLGQHLGMEAVAEGVETAAQLAYLGAEGCRIAQGFFFCPPVSTLEIDAMIATGADMIARLPQENSCAKRPA